MLGSPPYRLDHVLPVLRPIPIVALPRHDVITMCGAVWMWAYLRPVVAGAALGADELGRVEYLQNSGNRIKKRSCTKMESKTMEYSSSNCIHVMLFLTISSHTSPIGPRSMDDSTPSSMSTTTARAFSVATGLGYAMLRGGVCLVSTLRKKVAQAAQKNIK